MPSLRRALRARRVEWTQYHLTYLLTGHGWGFLPGADLGWPDDLATLNDEQLSETLTDMLQCWRANQHLITSEHCGINPTTEPPWFAEFASEAGIERLIAETQKDRAYMEYQRDHGGYRPYEEFEQQYRSPGAANARS